MKKDLANLNNEELTELYNTLNNNLSSLITKNRKIRELFDIKILEAKKQVQRLEEDLNSLLQDHPEASNIVDEVKKDEKTTVDKNIEINKLKSQFDKVNATNQQLKQKYQELKLKVEKLSKSVKDKETEVAKLVQTQNKTAGQMAEIDDTTLRAYKNRLKKLRETRESLQQESTDIRKTIERLKRALA